MPCCAFPFLLQMPGRDASSGQHLTPSALGKTLAHKHHAEKRTERGKREHRAFPIVAGQPRICISRADALRAG